MQNEAVARLDLNVKLFMARHFKLEWKTRNKHLYISGGRIEQWIAFSIAAAGLILGVPKNFSLDVAEIY